LNYRHYIIVSGSHDHAPSHFVEQFARVGDDPGSRSKSTLGIQLAISTVNAKL
jgi:hypothetical protein